jgi:hypothetical protein
MAIVFWDMKGMILIDIKVKGTPMNFKAYAANQKTQELNMASSSIKKAVFSCMTTQDYSF